MAKTKLLKVLLPTLILTMGVVSAAQAAILYDGADIPGVTTSDQYIIDYDNTSATNIGLSFGSAGTNYFRFDTVNSKFQISNNLDMQSFQLLNARVQNVSVLADVPSCSAAGDRGKQIYTGSASIANVNGAQTLLANMEYICNDLNPAATRWVASGAGGDATTLDNLDSTQFLRSDATDNYTAGTLTFDAGTTVTFTPTTTVNLPNTTANTFTVNNDAANGDSSTLSFGDGSGTIVWNDTTGNFTLNNSTTVSGTLTSNSLAVNSGGTVDLNLNQVQDLRLENVATLPVCNAASTGRHLYLTTLDGTNPPGDYICDGTTWYKSSISGTNNSLRFTAVFADSVNRPDGTNNIGTLTSAYDAANNRNYYRWSSNAGSLQDLDVVVDVRLPEDFGSWQATNPIQLDLRTTDTNTANNKIDLSGLDTSGTALTLTGATNLVSSAGNTWTPKNVSITGGTFTAGSRMQLTFKLHGLKTGGTNYETDLNSLRLNYVRKSP
jgi:hypothetical protein